LYVQLIILNFFILQIDAFQGRDSPPILALTETGEGEMIYMMFGLKGWGLRLPRSSLFPIYILEDEQYLHFFILLYWLMNNDGII
jgi:hypothetical protein